MDIKKNSGLKLWKLAKELIPGGNGLLSKRPERYLPGLWPTYFEKAKGIEIWDLDGNKYIDMAQMGLGTAILGYNDRDVNTAVKKAIDKGVNTTLNAPEEVYLAQLLLKLNPGFSMVKFARTGGEAMAMAVRIARAYSGRDKVAFSGYHGWHDWYISANLAGGDKLNGHLLPGLKPKGVPVSLKNTAFPFRYNHPKDLEKILKKEDIGVVVIEGARYEFPTKEFLGYIQDASRKRKIVVVADEITSGWRMTDGGVYKILGFNPDIAVYGKAMGNGFAISALIGKKKVMNCAQETFMSSTFWTERVGFAAALATIEKLSENKVWEHLNDLGNLIGEGWSLLAKKHGLKLIVTEFKPLVAFKFEYGNRNHALYTLFVQEMLKKGFLASNSVYISYAHKKKDIEAYLKNVDEVFRLIAGAIRSNTIFKRLSTRVMSEGFKRLT